MSKPDPDKEKKKSRVSPELFLSIGAFAVSIVSLWFSFLASPLSSAGRPQIYFHSIPATDTTPEYGTESFMTGFIENRSSNPAEQLLVTIMTLASEAAEERPHIVVAEGIEYSTLKSDKNFTTLKFETFPARYVCFITINRYKLQDGVEKQIAKGMPGVPCISSVTHKHGSGVRTP